MTISLSKKEIKKYYDNVRSAGYCELQTLLAYHDPVVHNADNYGRNFEVYSVYGVTICTGYRNLPRKKVIDGKKFERAAQAIRESYAMSPSEKREKIEDLLYDLCKLNGGY